MKDLLRIDSSIEQDIIQLLNDQVKMEATASSKYLAMASWCASHGYDNSANFFFTQSDEERVHMLKIFKYIIDLGGKAETPDVTKVTQDFSSLKDVFIHFLEAEIKVTHSINNILDKARKNKDYATESLMQWFVNEQIEEEFIARRAVELFNMLGEDKMALFMIDERIPKIQYSGNTSAKPTAE